MLSLSGSLVTGVGFECEGQLLIKAMWWAVVVCSREFHVVSAVLSTFYSLVYLPTFSSTSWLRLVIVEHLRWHTLVSPNSAIAFGQVHAVNFIRNHLFGFKNSWSHCSLPRSQDCLPSQEGVQVCLFICRYVALVCSSGVKVGCEPSNLYISSQF